MSKDENQPVSPSPELPPVIPQPDPVGTVVPPVASALKHGKGWMWVVLVIVVAALGGGAYFLYSQQQKPVVEISGADLPDITSQDGKKPNKGFDTSPSVASTSPTPAPTLTVSDSVSDIEKDISGTTLQAEEPTQFNSDLQGL